MFAESIGLPFKVPEEMFGCGPGNSPQPATCLPCLTALTPPHTRLCTAASWHPTTTPSARPSPHPFHVLRSFHKICRGTDGEDDGGDDESGGPNAKLEQAFRDLATYFKGIGEPGL